MLAAKTTAHCATVVLLQHQTPLLCRWRALPLAHLLAGVHRQAPDVLSQRVAVGAALPTHPRLQLKYLRRMVCMLGAMMCMLGAIIVWMLGAIIVWMLYSLVGNKWS